MLQMTLMPALLTISACLMLLKCYPASEDKYGQQQVALFGTFSGYMAWWACVCWSTYTSLGALFFRAQHAGLRQ